MQPEVFGSITTGRACRRGIIQSFLFTIAAAVFLFVNMTDILRSSATQHHRMSDPRLKAFHETFLTKAVIEKFGYSAAEWKSMIRLGVPHQIKSFCDAIAEANHSLVPDCSSSIMPDLWIGKKRESKVRLVVGLPTVLRPVKQYVKSTLKRLLRDLKPMDRNSTVILVFLADTDQTATQQLLSLFFQNFQSEIESGLIELLVPNRRFYKIMESEPCYGSIKDQAFRLDKTPCQDDYLRWRNKQNFDYSYLMAYGSQLGEFYLQMEDDMMCGSELFPKVFGAITSFSIRPFVFAEVTGRGFRGKMFRSNDTFHLSQYLLRRFDAMPCDWLYPIFAENLPNPCEADPERYPQAQHDCGSHSRKLRLVDEKGRDLCHHRGRFSSLKGKVVPIHLAT
ncbi:putative Alpha-1,3-mannosyl-glycoprotein 4-beta-N-acetylglucosaminyltransferase B [Hypsibius exemplaris]|uniref:Alpha-1,3-mannosyl-glycoprotein 4-beta-N-acetylglucosaminyltransferase B n=1 Tax=Hypsibius exemplaris TaxID=2072580 RepID=A0A1W0X7R2_HYPEX|nr:putative Alpha-1,3-mannosyl-glycoprotein 4-beta-N-acetylglucosaminyltransferase B [Hypsibius exemplaris]